jgi:hypothetical protein
MYFNNTLGEFCDDLIRFHPKDVDFKLFKNTFNMMKLHDERKPSQFFNNAISPYRSRIYSSDSSFFLENDFSDQLEGGMDVENFGQIMGKLKEYWANFSPDDKEVIWKYMHTLSKLSEK